MKTLLAIVALCVAPLADAQSESALPAAQSQAGVKYVKTLYAEFGDSWGLVDVLGAGTTMVTATSGSQSATAMLVVTQYTQEQVAVGRKRYYEPDNPGGARQACNDCHGSVQGADHSPLEMAYFPDDQVLKAIVDGKYDDGYVLQGVDHRWNLTDEEAQGIVPFLRSLAPMVF